MTNTNTSLTDYKSLLVIALCARVHVRLCCALCVSVICLSKEAWESMQ